MSKQFEKQLTIAYLKEGYESGEFTAEEICMEIVRRAEETKDMNIWIQAPDINRIKPYLENLSKIDQATSPLWGIPFAVKDNIDLESVPTTAGCLNYRYVPKESATVVRLLIDAGAIPIGKTNLDQFATGLVGTRSLFGETHNALQPEMISGGSSSGSAVSVAMGQCAFSLGTDTAGSGRVPAALNNLVGLKPSLGAWSTKGVVPACESLDCVTVFSHNLEDANLVDKVARVFDEYCPWSREFKEVKQQIPKIIYIPDKELVFFGPYADKFKAKWIQTIDKLTKLNIPIKKIDYSIFSEAASFLYDGPWIAERWSSLGEFVETNHGKGMHPVTEKILRSGNKESLKADEVFKVIHRLSEIKRQVEGLLKDSILLLPTAGGTYTIEQVNEDPIQTNSNMGLYTNHCNLLDLCALNFQSGFADTNIPFGITSFALRGEEGLNFGMAKLYQDMNNSDMLEVAVCGLHMRGLALESQMLDLNAQFVKETKTASSYKMLKLPTNPTKPGLIRVNERGVQIQVEVWRMPVENIGLFLKTIPAPLGLGKILLEDGNEITGFICEGYMESIGEDVSTCLSWRNVAI